MPMIETTLLNRLRRGAASIAMLARWCDVPKRVVQPALARLMVAGDIVRRGDKFDVPRAGRVVIHGYRT